MNKLFLCLLFSLFSLVGFSQKIYFVYLQTESEQPFFVKLKEKVHSSTGTGYLIIPRLHDSTYIINVGFPDAKWPEQTFTIAINHKDRGYLLKNFGEKGWGLFDLQTLNVQMSSTGKAAIDNKPAPLPGDVSPFTDILAKVADDPSLKDRPIRPKPEVKKEEVVQIKQPEKKEEKTVEPVTTKTEPVQTAVVKKEEPVEIKPAVVVEKPAVKKDETAETKPSITVDQPVSKKEETVETKPLVTTEQPVVKKEEKKAEPVVTEPVTLKTDDRPAPVEEKKEETYSRSEVTKTAEAALTEGLNIVFVDKYDNGQKDTIKLIIPNPKPLVEPANEPVKEEKKFLEINTETPKSEETKNKATTAEVTNPKESGKPEVKNTTNNISSETPAKPAVVNKCISTATENDFLKARRKMAAGETDDEMVFEARKYFKADCFTVYQIRNLSTLFLTDEGKYKFFDAAYPYASDPHNFISLQLELKEEYYVKRFKAMLK